MTWIWLVLLVVVLGATTAVAAGLGDRMRVAYPDRPDVRAPASGMLHAQDLAEMRFSVTLRGYRMDEVDDVLARLTREIAVRDAELARLSGGEPSAGRPAPSDPEEHGSLGDPERDEDVGAVGHAGDRSDRHDHEDGPNRTGGSP